MLAAIFTDFHFADKLSQELLVTRLAGTYIEGVKTMQVRAPRARIWEDTIPVQNWNVAMSRTEEVWHLLNLYSSMRIIFGLFTTISTFGITYIFNVTFYVNDHFWSCSGFILNNFKCMYNFIFYIYLNVHFI